ncbi:hypothetical protein OBBRIDRAFT_891102 [Obba rivulosa]|uniref:Uncharacterized protein n=1 Tax=Obba rivulosa TaxID=1052685 RepID=A0A8E2AUG5_9APHY|nr:hypothetical protein OBBRIDRAFT_891102 [Obba rivulosa]
MSSLPYEDVLELNRQFIRYWVIDTQVLTHMEAKEILESMKEMTEEETARAGYDFCIESGWPPQEAYKLWYGEAVQQLKSDQEVRRQEHPTDAENTTEIDAPVDGAAQLHQHLVQPQQEVQIMHPHAPPREQRLPQTQLLQSGSFSYGTLSLAHSQQTRGTIGACSTATLQLRPYHGGDQIVQGPHVAERPNQEIGAGPAEHSQQVMAKNEQQDLLERRMGLLRKARHPMPERTSKPGSSSEPQYRGTTIHQGHHLQGGRAELASHGTTLERGPTGQWNVGQRAAERSGGERLADLGPSVYPSHVPLTEYGRRR